MRAANFFITKLKKHRKFTKTTSVQIHLYGSLAATGKGHRTDIAILGGLEGANPKNVDPLWLETRYKEIKQSNCMRLGGKKEIPFKYNQDIFFHLKPLPLHPNGMKFIAFNHEQVIYEKIFYSIGGGFIVGQKAAQNDKLHAFDVDCQICSADKLLSLCQQENLSIANVVLQYEKQFRSITQINRKLDKIWDTMNNAIEAGLSASGRLPGKLKVKRLAAQRFQHLSSIPIQTLKDPLTILDWVTLYALAVNEENAAGGRVVTAPTNGAAGIIPAVIRYYTTFTPGANKQGIRKFLLTAGMIGLLYKINASISGAEVGCQGEVGVACSMAAAGLTEVLGGTPLQVENAAEIAMEHNLGLTCDPIEGLVQIPCIERNAMAAVKAINAARMALQGDGHHYVSLDSVMKTMKETGLDMRSKYKETSKGGLAVNVTAC